MTTRKTTCCYIYDDIAREIIEWAKQEIRKHRIPKPMFNLTQFPYYLDQYIKYLKDRR